MPPPDDENEEDAAMLEPLDARLRDDDVLDEIDLTTDLMIAATESEGPLEQAEVDRILGLD